ncbi:MAG: adenine deaminase [Lentisphaerae bacterium]|nr:adenine deaminase [Lentisphaerota bacterium]
MKHSAEQKKRLIGCALGNIEADLIISGVNVFHLTDGSTEKCDIAVIDGKIAGLGCYSRGKTVIDGTDLFAVPGFVDSHVHLESSHLLPGEYEKLVLAHGVTTAICDPHELANVVGEKAFEFFFSAAEKLSMSLIVNLSSCVPATGFETAGAEVDSVTIRKWKELHPESTLAELMNVPGLLFGDEEVLAKAALFDHIDGHCPLISGKELNACAAAGVVNCHESTLYAEAAEKLRRGIQVFIREGSAAKNLDTLLPLITLENSPFISFCTDDISPLEIVTSGHIDSMIRRAIASGANPLAVYRTASWSGAKHAGLNDRGLLAPGRRADIVLLSDLEKCIIKEVIVSGKQASTLPDSTLKAPEEFYNSVKCQKVTADDFTVRSGKTETFVIGVESGSLITEKLMRKLPVKDGKKYADPANDILKAAVIERHGKNGNIGLGFVHGSGIKSGALATTVAHDSHNICVIGTTDEDIAAAVNALIQQQGGLVVVQNGQVTAALPFPVAGLFTDCKTEEFNSRLQKVMTAAAGTGCTLQEPFQQLSFLALPVIPHLKLTDKGVFDADIFQHVPEN